MSITGFGHDGPEGGRAGYDQIAQGEAGLMSMTGSGPDDPQKFGTPIADLLAGMYGAYGVVSALYERERTGRGQVVRTSLLAAAVGHARLPGHPLDGGRRGRPGRRQPSRGDRAVRTVPLRDGAVQIAVGSEGLWRKFCAGFGLDPSEPLFATNPDRVTARDALIARIESVFADWDAADLLIRLDELGIPAGKVRSIDEVYDWDQTASQGLLMSVDHGSLGPLTLPGPPLRFFAADGTEQTRTTHTAPPTLDEDGAAVRAWLSETPTP